MISDDLLTRYQNALVQITSFWQDCDIKIYDLESIDEAVSLYLEFIFSEGEPKGLASDTLASVQFFLPSASGKLRHSWKLVKTWQKIEPPTRLYEPLRSQGFRRSMYPSQFEEGGSMSSPLF